ncbi:MAG: hypothetical protein ACI83W_000863 [Marinoscillum sp.]|jgi:hypothetical protein
MVSFGFAQKKHQDTSSYIHQDNRLEFNLGAQSMDFELITGDELGLLAVVATNISSQEGLDWILHSIDTALVIRWTKIFSIPFASRLLGTEYHDGSYYLLFNAAEYSKEDLLLIEINAVSGNYKRMEINTVFPIQLSFFEVLDGNVIFSGYTNYRPVLLTFDLEEEKLKVVPGFYENKSDILDVIIDDDARLFTVIQQDYLEDRKITTIRAKTFISDGSLIQDNLISPGDRKSLLDGTSTIFQGGYQYLAGTYSRKPSEYSRGLYLSKFMNGRQQFVKYHDYSDLTNFFGFMNPKREKRVLDRIKRKREKGKQPHFSYRLMVHDIIRRGDEYLMIAEAYYPRYNSVSNLANNGYSSYGMTPGFSGYQYTHAILVAFDRNGEILWDNSFEINDIETYSLQEFVAVNVLEDKVVLMYLEENLIRSKVVMGNEVYEGKTFNPVKLSNPTDELKSRDPEVEGLRKWYGNIMYAFGEQRIDSNSSYGRNSRRVFYINKVSCSVGDVPN